VNLEPGRMLLHYRLVQRLGEGGMGVVWKAVDTALEREVAVKILPEEFAADPERLSRFEREARLLASLNHPNVAAVYGLHEDRGVRFLAMELVRGRSLTDEIAKGLAPQRVLELAAAIADGLAAAHRQHVTHRDLKPDNIMIADDGRPKVLDFGLAKLGGVAASPDAATTTQAGSILGTVSYMSPEQAQGKPVDPRSDIFSLGIVLYEMTTGRRPFAGDNSVSILTSILRDTPAPVTASQPAAPAPLDRIIGRCLEKRPDARYVDASELASDLRALLGDFVSAPRSAGAGPRTAPRVWILAGAAAAILLAVTATLWYRHSERQRWVRNEALPRLTAIVDRIQGLQEGRESWDAFVLAGKIDAVAPGDPLLERLRTKFTREISITSDPPGASVYAWYYDEPQAEPVLIGTTPLPKVGYPLGFTRIKLKLAGRPDLDDVIWNLSLVGDAWAYRFHAKDDVPEGMAFVPGGEFAMFLPGLDHLKPEPTAAFAMDRYEVTNRAYKKFLDAGGYGDPKFWREPFVDGGRELSFKEAIARFTDRTGRPGPATWEVGAYPEGRDDDPVSGVSWYEAAAYAVWAGKSLPTIFHWNRVAFTVASSRIVPMSNLAGNGAVATGSTKSMNRFGVYDLAGNVREWTWNASDRGQGRFILGGGWSDQDYAFADSYAQPAFDRSPTNGFRCIRYLEQEGNLSALQRAIDRPHRDFLAEKPVPDAVFAQYLRQFAYDKAPLDAKIEEEKPTSSGLRQKITFNAAYGGERMMAYLFLPTTGKPPYQVVVEFPGSGAISTRSSESLDLGRVDFLPLSGRAVIFPIYKGTYERGGDLHSDYANETTAYKDYVIMWAKDLARSIDYVESRNDLDATRIAYYGLSWGGGLGSILPAVETRIKANVLYVAGLGFQHALPEADEINYVTRVKQPTLILNGELDFFFPSETSQRPMFELLGTPAADKKRLVFPGGHSVPRTEMIKESLDWLDRYLGPVRDVKAS
jgi:formylglycine-generating enzyme required for sulfatase activity/dienelactone hydrolase/predicted Ser/Thr protein kinase